MDRVQLRELFDYADGQFFWRRKVSKKTVVGRSAGSVRPDGYTLVSANGERDYLHRLVWVWHHGAIPEGLRIDHIDQNPRNNRIENLRLLTHAQNLANNAATGVSRCGQKYQAGFGRGGYLGLYNTFDEARAAYLQAKCAFIAPGGV